MLSNIKSTDCFCDYYLQWIDVYKKGAIRKVTLDKYFMTYTWLVRLAPDLHLCELTETHTSKSLMIMLYIMKDKQQWIFIIN